ncbi:hypothetical protein [Chryseolinea lacunae]|uniref:Uncharacterized protein n=1 Tax=Chryseolinea lacunae TaxID=2801331 RepID=A0ABS1L0X1_9BACT|nr:hypothetical protein [Chryseolinea lacunae]MBL0744577.1 hypothetical protein [Chryseolinea lacunae]
METTKKPIEVFTITGDWAMQSKLLKLKYAQLTDADLKFETGTACPYGGPATQKKRRAHQHN